jgi:hypothetical protein
MILFGCDDIGPGRYIAALGKTLGTEARWIGGNLTKPFFSDLGFRVIDNLDFSIKPSLVVTGTQLGYGLDKHLLIKSREWGIKSISIIEHWSWYRKRFEIENGLLLPDCILVNDQIALENAITEGLPAEILFHLGNPVLEELALKKISISLDRLAILEKYNLPFNKRIIVFLSEELGSEFKKGTDHYLGYDEFEVLRIIQLSISSSDHLVIKLHPTERSDKYNELCHPSITYIDHIPVDELASIANIIIGMASMLLLELAMFRDDVISFRPNATKPFIGELLGVTVPACDNESLHQAFSMSAKNTADFQRRFIGSKVRILNFFNNFI